MKQSAAILLFIVFLAFGCTKKQIPSTVIYGLDYYPTTQNKFVVYDVDSTIYIEIPKDTITYRYRIKEKIADTFTDNEGQPAIRLERYIKKYDPAKPYDSIAWSVKEVWLVNATDKTIQVVEGNIRYTKLIFPVSERASWDGNAQNTQGQQLYMYDYIDKAETINNNVLQNVLSVKQYQFRTLISYQNYTEKYAKGVGLVYREIQNILSNSIVANIPVEGRIESGLIYKQTLVTYGYE